MKNVDKLQRQLIRCGWEVPAPPPYDVCVSRLSVLGYEPGDGPDDQISQCPGYLTQLPEVIEIARARFHAEKTSIEAFCGGPPSEPVLYGIEILEGSYNECRDWATKNPVPK